MESDRTVDIVTKGPLIGAERRVDIEKNRSN